MKRLEPEGRRFQHGIMRSGIFFAVLLVLAPFAWAAEMTAAWKVPLDYVSPHSMGGGKLPKLAKPPGESAFFQPGDELLDLSRGFMGMRVKDDGITRDPADLLGFRKWPGKWLVWNARSGMLVVRGSEMDILMTEDVMKFVNLPVTLRTRLELSSGSAEKLRTVTLGAQHDKRAKAEGEGLKMSIKLLDPGHIGYGDAALAASWEVNGEPWSLETAFTVHYGERTRIAAHGTGEERWELFATITREFFHGVPVSASRWRETKQGIEPWPLGEESSRMGGGNALEVGVYRVPPDLLARLGVESEEAGAVDPFRPEKEPAIAKMGAGQPGGWEGWVLDDYTDMREIMRQKGVRLEDEGSFAVFNPRTNSVLVRASSMDHDLFGVLVADSGCYLRGDLWVTSNPESGAWGLTARSGDRASLRSSRDGRDMNFEIEPSLEDAFFTQIQYEFKNRAEAGSGISVSAASKFLLGSPQVIGSHQAPGREEQKVVLTASYLYE